MVNKKVKIKWGSIALKQFKQSIQYISKDSSANSEKVKSDILNAVEELAKNPTRYPADKYRIDNNPDYRALELHHFRISYLISNSEIFIIRFRHTGQLPVQY